MKVEELREALRELPQAELDQLICDLLTDPRNETLREQVARLLAKGVIAPAGITRVVPASEAEVKAATKTVIDQYRPALERLSHR